MHRTRPGRTALAALALLAVAAIASAASAGAHRAGAHRHRPRRRDELDARSPRRALTLSAGNDRDDGVAGHTCTVSPRRARSSSRRTATGRGPGRGACTAISSAAVDGLSLPSTGAEYWAFWVNDAPASQGICGYKPKPGDSILFFPDCYGKKCPPNDGVLGVKAPATATAGSRARHGHRLLGRRRQAQPGGGRTVSGAGASEKTAADGGATITFTKPGRFWLRVSARPRHAHGGPHLRARRRPRTRAGEPSPASPIPAAGAALLAALALAGCGLGAGSTPATCRCS